MSLSKITSWVSSTITNPAVGALTGAVYGLQQRLVSSENVIASTILNKPLQDAVWNSVGTRLQAIQNLLSINNTQQVAATAANTGLTFLSTPIRYLPGVIGSLIAIAYAKDWVAGGVVVQGEKAQRTMAVAATIALTVLPTLIEASGLVPTWANFGELATAMTQGMALYYAAKAASLYGHKTTSKLLIGGSALLSAINFTYFSQHAFGFTTSPDTVSNLLAGIVTTGSILGGAKVFSWTFGRESKKDAYPKKQEDKQLSTPSNIIVNKHSNNNIDYDSNNNNVDYNSNNNNDIDYDSNNNNVNYNINNNNNVIDVNKKELTKSDIQLSKLEEIWNKFLPVDSLQEMDVSDFKHAIDRTNSYLSEFEKHYNKNIVLETAHIRAKNGEWDLEKEWQRMEYRLDQATFSIGDQPCLYHAPARFIPEILKALTIKIAKNELEVTPANPNLSNILKRIGEGHLEDEEREQRRREFNNAPENQVFKELELLNKDITELG